MDLEGPECRKACPCRETDGRYLCGSCGLDRFCGGERSRIARGYTLLVCTHCSQLALTQLTLHSFHPAAQRVRAIIKSGELGEIKSLKGEFAIPSLLSPLFFMKDDVRYSFDLGGGCLMDMGGERRPWYARGNLLILANNSIPSVCDSLPD